MEILESSILLPSERNVESMLSLNEVLNSDKPRLDQRDEVKNNIVAIHGLNGDGTSSLGSGLFLTTDGFVLTAYHVIKDYFPIWERINTDTRLTDLEKLIFVIDKDGNRFPLDTTFASYNEFSDLAVIKSIKPGRPRPKHYKLSESLRVGEKLFFVAPEAVDYQRGIELRQNYREILGFRNDQIYLRGPGKFGQSGSPYLNQDGELAGIHCGRVGIFNSYAADPNNIIRIIQSTVENLRQSYIDRTGHDPLSRVYLPFWVHDDHRNKILKNIKIREIKGAIERK